MPSGATSLRRASTLRRFLADQPIRRKLACAGAAFVAVIGLLFATGYFAMETLSTVRAFVGGEGLWSKGQKDAVFHLTKYAHSGDEADYRKYRELLRVPLSDKRARLELEKENSDLDIADQAFIEARNDPADVRAMSLLFKRFRHISYIDRAIGHWAKGDLLIEELDGYADELHGAVLAGPSSHAERERILVRIDSVAERLTVVEDDFSYTLGEAARWLRQLLIVVMAVAAAVGLSFGAYVAFMVSNGVLSDVASLRRGTALVGAGNFGERIPVTSQDELGELARAFNQMTDSLVRSIEERRAAEEQLASHARDLEAANEALLEHEKVKSDFFSTVSHELRTPLSLILAPLESLLDDEYGRIPAWARPSLETMHNNTIRLLQMVQGLLDFQKLEANKALVRREPLDVAALTRSILTDFEGMMRARGLRARIEIVPEGALNAEMDRYMYERIVFNLLSNAAKFTPEGGEIVVRLERSGERLTLSVRDTGIGISADDAALLFKRFQQVEGAATRRFEGVGLGLALVKEFSELLSGGVSVESAVGQGSTFIVKCLAPEAVTVTKPIADSTPRQSLQYRGFAGVVSEPQVPRATPSDPLDGRILIVEDNPELARYISECLAETCETKIVHDGDEALRAVHEWEPTLVISDVMMPKRDGLSLCRELKADPKTRGIPVVLLTALTYREALLKGWEAGADDYLFKPFHPAELVTRMRALLSAQLRLLSETEGRMAAEQALLRTTRQLEDAQRIAHVGSWEWDIAANKISWSDELYRIFGLDPARFSATYEAYLERVHPDDRSVAEQSIRAALESREPFSFEHRVVRDGGSEGWVYSRGRVQTDESGTPIRMAGTAHDITEHKQMVENRVRLVEAQVARTAAEDARERSAVLAGASAFLGSSLDYKRTLAMMEYFIGARFGGFCLVSLASPESFVAKDERALGDSRRARWIADPEVQACVARVLRTGIAEKRGPESDTLGSLGLTSALVVPVVARGEILGTIAVGTAEAGRVYQAEDLELIEELGRRAGLAIENARLYEAAQKARESAVEANRAKDDFLATVSHELRTPMNAMLGWTCMLRAGHLPEEKRDRALETIERNVRNQAKLIEDLLDVSRIISGKLVLDVQPVDLREVVGQAIETLRPASAAKDVRIFASLDERVGCVKGDPRRLQQVVWNLLNNSVKFTPSGGRIDLTLEAVDGHARIVVTDNGLGIAPDFLPRVFERFSQADGTTTRSHGGLGIGLAISKQIVEAHGGKIEASSAGKGQGATFTVSLGLFSATVDTDANDETRGRTSTRATAAQLRDVKVLVVDDEEDVRELLSEILEKRGATVRVATSVASALECVRRERPDVLVSDIGMPGEDGYALLRQLRALGVDREIPAAALTAYAGAEDRQRSATAGFLLHLAKPVEPAELIAAVANLTRRSPRD